MLTTTLGAVGLPLGWTQCLSLQVNTSQSQTPAVRVAEQTQQRTLVHHVPLVQLGTCRQLGTRAECVVFV